MSNKYTLDIYKALITGDNTLYSLIEIILYKINALIVYEK